MTRPSTRSRLPALLALGALFLAGCARGPDGPAMKAELQGRLDAFVPGSVFEVTRLVRNGSYPFSDPDTGGERLLVYFKARLTFRKDYGLAEWDAVNAGALATLLGATADGIEGVVGEGNKAGDVLKVHGSAIYRPEGATWVLDGAGPEPPTPARKGPAPSDEETPLQALLHRLDEEVRWHVNRGKGEHLEVFERELELAARSVHLQLDRLDGRISLMTAGPGSEYRAVGAALAATGEELGREIRAYPSDGSVENCRMIGERRAEFAIVQNDVARLAQTGAALIHGIPPMPDLRAVCTLFPEAIHLVSLEDRGIGGVRDLRGKRVGLGASGSGTRLNAHSVLGAYGMNPGDLKRAASGSLDESVAALLAGELDAFFVTRAYPAPALEKLAAKHPMVLVPIAGPEAAALARRLPYFPRMHLAANTYPGQEADVPTLGVTAMVVGLAEVPDARVTAILDVLFSGSRTLSRGNTVGNYITRRSARLGLSVPLHPAAEKYFAAPGE